MTIKKQFFIFFALVIAAIQASHAAILIEPVVGFTFSNKFDFKETADMSKDSMKGSGFAYGGRVGYQNMGFQLGLDYLHSSVDVDEKNIKSDVTTSEWAAFAGFRFPILLRFYAGYIFSGTGEYKNTTSNVDLSNGTGYKIGLGWTLLPFLDLNLEYKKTNYDEAKAGGSKLKADIDNSSYLLSVSLPFTF
jgi:hypothetical protein